MRISTIFDQEVSHINKLAVIIDTLQDDANVSNIMQQVVTSIFFILVWLNLGFAQHASSFFPAVNSSLFDESIIQRRAYLKAIVQGTYNRNGELGNLYEQHFYFDKLGSIVYCQVYDGDSLIQCMDLNELLISEHKYHFDTTYFKTAWAHVEEGRVAGPLNCVTLTLNGHVKQVLYEDSLPIGIDMLNQPLYERFLDTYWIKYYTDCVYPQNCISKRQAKIISIKNQQRLQDSMLLSSSVWPSCFASGEMYKVHSLDRTFLQELTSLWDIIECDWLTKENYRIVEFHLIGMEKEVALTYHLTSDKLPSNLVAKFGKWDNYSVYGIIVQRRNTSERLELGGFSKYITLEP